MNKISIISNLDKNLCVTLEQVLDKIREGKNEIIIFDEMKGGVE